MQPENGPRPLIPSMEPVHCCKNCEGSALCGDENDAGRQAPHSQMPFQKASLHWTGERMEEPVPFVNEADNSGMNKML